MNALMGWQVTLMLSIKYMIIGLSQRVRANLPQSFEYQSCHSFPPTRGEEKGWPCGSSRLQDSLCLSLSFSPVYVLVLYPKSMTTATTLLLNHPCPRSHPPGGISYSDTVCSFWVELQILSAFFLSCFEGLEIVHERVKEHMF